MYARTSSPHITILAEPAMFPPPDKDLQGYENLADMFAVTREHCIDHHCCFCDEHCQWDNDCVPCD